MPRTLVLLFHPDPAGSRANRALAEAARARAGVDVIDMHARYPDGTIDLARDGAREAARLTEADRLVWQFPLQWYSVPPLLKAWQDAVLTRMFYVAFDTEGRRLAGRPLRIAVTTGNVAEAYAEGGTASFSMSTLLAPLEATARRCGLVWQAPFVLHDARHLDDAALAAAGRRYADLLAAGPDALPPS